MLHKFGRLDQTVFILQVQRSCTDQEGTAMHFSLSCVREHKGAFN